MICDKGYAFDVRLTRSACVAPTACRRQRPRERPAARAARLQGAPCRARRLPGRRGGDHAAAAGRRRSRAAEGRTCAARTWAATSTRGRSRRTRCHREAGAARRRLGPLTRLLPCPPGVYSSVRESSKEESAWLASRSPPARRRRSALRRPLPARRPRLPARPRRQLQDLEGGEGPPRPRRRGARRRTQPGDVLEAITESRRAADVRRLGRGVPGEPRRPRRRDIEEPQRPPEAMPAFDDRDPATITPADVQEWIAGLTLKPSSMRSYLGTLRDVLDFAGVDPNPARDCVSGCRAGARSSTRRPPPTSTRSSRSCRRGCGFRSACSSRPGCASGRPPSSSGATSTNRCRGSGSAGQDRRGPPLGRGSRVADGRGRRHLPARGPHGRAPGVPRLHARRRGTRWPAPARRPGSSTGTRTTSATATPREDRPRRPGDDARGAARPLEEVPDAGHVLACDG